MNVSNKSEYFEIEIKVQPQNKIHRLRVEHFYTSPTAERFKIHGRDRHFIIMEKCIEGRKQLWKITEGTIDAKNIQHATRVIRDIQNALDQMLNKVKHGLEKDINHLSPPRN